MYKNFVVISFIALELWVTKVVVKSDVCKWRVLQSQSHIYIPYNELFLRGFNFRDAAKTL